MIIAFDHVKHNLFTRHSTQLIGPSIAKTMHHFHLIRTPFFERCNGNLKVNLCGEVVFSLGIYTVTLYKLLHNFILSFKHQRWRKLVRSYVKQSIFISKKYMFNGRPTSGWSLQAGTLQIWSRSICTHALKIVWSKGMANLQELRFWQCFWSSVLFLWLKCYWMTYICLIYVSRDQRISGLERFQDSVPVCSICLIGGGRTRRCTPNQDLTWDTKR